ncbi:MAG: four helix bundle protein [Prevotella sp.]
MKENVVYELSKKFALRIIKLYKFLSEEKKEQIISRQVCRSGTSIGANLAESVFASSSADFIHKMKIALKEANETSYWLELLLAAEYISDKEYQSISQDLKIIIGTLVNMINKLKLKQVTSE